MTDLVVMEHDSSISKMFREVFEIEGYTVLPTVEPAGALAILREHPHPIVAFLHLRNSDDCGMEVLAAVEAEGGMLRRHAYVLYTWRDLSEQPEQRQRIFRMGAWLIRMPTDVQAFVGVVEQAARTLPSRP